MKAFALFVLAGAAGLAAPAQGQIIRWNLEFKIKAYKPTNGDVPTSTATGVYALATDIQDYVSDPDNLCLSGDAASASGCDWISRSVGGCIGTTTAHAGGATCGAWTNYSNPCDAFADEYSNTWGEGSLYTSVGVCDGSFGTKFIVLSSAAGVTNIGLWVPPASTLGWKFCSHMRFWKSSPCGSADPGSGVANSTLFFRFSNSGGTLSTARVEMTGDAAGNALVPAGFTSSSSGGITTYEGDLSVNAPSGATKVEVITLSGRVGCYDLNNDGVFNQDDITLAGSTTDPDVIARIDFTDGFGGGPDGDVQQEELDLMQLFLDTWEVLPYDVNRDGVVDCDDLSSGLNDALTDSPSFPIALGSDGYDLAIDADHDGFVSAAEASRFLTRVNPSDYDQNGFTDMWDYDAFTACFTPPVSCPSGRDADINLDGFVDLFDYDDYVYAYEHAVCH